MAQVWLPHPVHVWIPGTPVGTDANGEKFEVAGDNSVTLSESECEELQPVRDDQKKGVDDICTLSAVNEGALLHTVRVRYLAEIIYTRVADVVIAVNPFKPLPIYDSATIEKYMSSSSGSELPPHIFRIGQDALQGLRRSTRNQAVLISGESGAGKTESVKLILSFVTASANVEEGGVETRVLQTNPVLEAFGNATTVRNNNSSRFGKWIDLCWTPQGDIGGCVLTSYLLETTRICKQGPGERSFHVFFQLLEARNQQPYAALGLEEPRKYRYLKDGAEKATGINDSACFQELRLALDAFGFNASMVLEILRIVAGVLVLGNCEFKEEEEAQLTDTGPLEKAAAAFGVDAQTLQGLMLRRKIVVGREVTLVKNRPEQARGIRDGLARCIYGRLFLWLIEKMNAGLDMGANLNGQSRLLGLLDIAGFECFKFNSLEQLLINLSNEHLQQHFNQVVFKAEEKECHNEGIPPPPLADFVDNEDCLALIDSKGGILDCLEETFRLPKATDLLFVNKVVKDKASHSRIIPPGAKETKCGFAVKHFAGDVFYTCTGWLDKNVETLPPGTAECIAFSSFGTLQEIGKTIMTEEAENGTSPKKGPKSVSAGFRTSLASLMNKIKASDPHFVRCVKPNMEKLPGEFTAKIVMEQLLFSGVLAAVNVRQKGYTYRPSHADFAFQYACILGAFSDDAKSLKAMNEVRKMPNGKPKAEKLAEALPQVLAACGHQVDGKYFAVGNTKVFMKRDAFQAIDACRQNALRSTAIKIQRAMRGVYTRRWTKEVKALNDELFGMLDELGCAWRENARRRSKTDWGGSSLIERVSSSSELKLKGLELARLLKKTSELGFSNIVISFGERAQRRITAELDAINELEGMRKSVDPIGIVRVLARANGLKMPELEITKHLTARCDVLKIQIPLIKAMKDGLAGFDGDDAAKVEQLRSVVRDAGKIDAKAWITELEGAVVADKVARAINEYDEKIRREQEEKIRSEQERMRREQDEQIRKERDEQIRREQDEKARELDRLERERLEKERLEKERLEKEGLENERLEKEADAAKVAKGDLVKSDAGTLQKRKSKLDVKDIRNEVAQRLSAASQDLDEQALQESLAEAVANGMEDNAEHERTCAAATSVFAQLQEDNFLTEAFEMALEQAMVQDPPVLALKRLENVARQLKKLDGYGKEIKESVACIQECLVRRARLRGLRSVFDLTDPVELEMADRHFESIERFALVRWERAGVDRPPSMRRLTTRRSALVNLISIRSTDLLKHSKTCIGEALTDMVSDSKTTSEEYEAGAVQNFWNLLVAMGDRPAQELQRIACHESVINMSKQASDLRNEVYVQLMKQLRSNPTPRSECFGWELMNVLCHEAPPSGALSEFVRVFIRNASHDFAERCDDRRSEVWIKGVAKASMESVSNAQAKQGGFFQDIFGAFKCCVGVQRLPTARGSIMPDMGNQISILPGTSIQLTKVASSGGNKTTRRKSVIVNEDDDLVLIKDET